MTKKCSLTAICLVMVLIFGAFPGLAQPDRHDEQDEAASPGALAQYRKGERLAKNGQFTEAILAYRRPSASSRLLSRPITRWAWLMPD